MGGLAVAARLATVGHSVVVCEQSGSVGGKVASFSRDGFTFDTGPSLLTLPAVYRDLFVKTGKPIEEAVDLVPVDPAFRYRFPAAEGSGREVDHRSGGRGAPATPSPAGKSPATGRSRAPCRTSRPARAP